jgi:hypothetical protein
MKTQQEIEKEFKKRFSRTGFEIDDDLREGYCSDIIAFIRQLRQDDIKSLIEWIEKNSEFLPCACPKGGRIGIEERLCDRCGGDEYLKIIKLSDIFFHLHSQLKELN